MQAMEGQQKQSETSGHWSCERHNKEAAVAGAAAVADEAIAAHDVEPLLAPLVLGSLDREVGHLDVCPFPMVRR
jgi:hypothetical protein